MFLKNRNIISKMKRSKVTDYAALRNLPTHTVNNLLQKLNVVKRIQLSVVKQKFNIIVIICEDFSTIPCVLCKIQHI